MTAGGPGEPPLLEVRGLVKEYPGVRALDGVDFTVVAGQVHCLVGQNGAGKSTLIKCIAGLVTPTSGEVVVGGAPLPPGDPAAALAHGVATIYQELDLVDDLTVADNLFLGHELRRGPLLDRPAMRRATTEVLDRLGHGTGHGAISPRALVGGLPPAAKQIVSIARALTRDARLLIMDEPSAVLGDHEVQTLFDVIRRLTAEGVGVVYISHRLEEVAAIGEATTVLRDGRTVASDLPASTPRSELITAMVGRSFTEMFPEREPSHELGPVVLRVEGLTRRPAVDSVSFEVREGEIFGIGGLVGAGRTELLRLIAGLDRPDSGQVTVGDHRLPPGRPHLASRAGVGLAPEERKAQGVWPGWDLVRNVTVADLRRFRRRGLLDRRAERTEAVRHLRELQTVPDDPDRFVTELSGGNQQKVVLARWLLRHCRVLLLDEPTRGVDVGAKTEIYRVVHTLAAGGLAVVLVSSELAELVGLCDRILVLAEGRPTALLEAPGITEAELLAHALPGSPDDESKPSDESEPSDQSEQSDQSALSEQPEQEATR
jgi:ribose transport system ATP-binding protein